MDKIKMIHKFIGDRVRYDTNGGGYIWSLRKNDGIQMLAQVEDPEDPDNYVLSIRGWGAIQHMFKNIQEAHKFQDQIGEWIAEAINEKIEKESNETVNEYEIKHFYLDQADDLRWLIKTRNGERYTAGTNKQKVIDLVNRLNNAHRPNVKQGNENEIYVCWNEHEKGQDCEYVQEI